MCVLPPGIEPDSTEYMFTEDGVPVSNFHPDAVDDAAKTARTVFVLDPYADPDSVRHLPAPFNELTCPARFSMLPSKEPNVAPLPEASLELSVHKPPKETVPVPQPVTAQLSNCPSVNAARFGAMSYTMTFHVYVTDNGEAVGALVDQSTLDDDDTTLCMLEALRKTSWTVEVPVVAKTVPLGAKMFFAQPQPVPVDPIPDMGDRPSGIYPKQGPQNAPGGRPVPFVATLPLIGPIVVGGIVFVTILVLPNSTAPAWVSELNPITGKPYTDWSEYQEVQWMSPQEIQQRQAARIKATQSQPPPPASTPTPAPAPPPAPTLTPQQQREQEKQRERCAKLAKKIDDIINKERDPTPPGGRPQGRKGIKWRWSEIAENKGKWAPKPDGSPSRTMQGHLLEYDKGQEELISELDNWKTARCDDRAHGLPHNARQYAAQKPEFGPGKPMVPAPTPEYYPRAIPPAIVPQPKKASK